MLVVNLAVAGLAVAFLILAAVGLRGGWPMQVASLVALAGWVVAGVWSVLTVLRVIAGSSDAASASDALSAYVLVLAPTTGLGLAFLAFVKCGPPVVPRLFHALGLGALVAAVAGVSIPDDEDAPGWVWALVVVLPVVWGIAWLVGYLLLRGSVDPARYAAAPANYRLPFPSGARTWVIQGNNSRFNHNHANLTQGFSWDFRRGCGTPVLAALGGRVTSIIDSHDGIGGQNNEIEVTHADGSVASYLHIQKGSARVAVGATVAQGQRLASVGSVGHSLTGHLHFHVRVGPDTIPLRFGDVARHSGIPRGFRFYVSGNTPAGP